MSVYYIYILSLLQFQFLKLRFRNFNTEACCDHVYLRDGFSQSDALITQLSGDWIDLVDPPYWIGPYVTSQMYAFRIAISNAIIIIYYLYAHTVYNWLFSCRQGIQSLPLSGTFLTPCFSTLTKKVVQTVFAPIFHQFELNFGLKPLTDGATREPAWPL